jgi:hypothetical protein
MTDFEKEEFWKGLAGCTMTRLAWPRLPKNCVKRLWHTNAASII